METVTFKILGNWVNYIINGTGTHETLRFGDTCLVDASGDVGPYRSKSWRATLTLRGAARESARQSILREHAEHLLATELHNIPALYSELNAE